MNAEEKEFKNLLQNSILDLRSVLFLSKKSELFKTLTSSKAKLKSLMNSKSKNDKLLFDFMNRYDKKIKKIKFRGMIEDALFKLGKDLDGTRKYEQENKPIDIRYFQNNIDNVVTKPNQRFHADLADMNVFNIDKRNYRFRFLLVMVDVFSRFVYVVPVRRKNETEISIALEYLYEMKLGFKNKKIKHLQVDRGSEFYNKEVKKVNKKFKVEMYSTNTNQKAFIAEQKIREIKKKLNELRQIEKGKFMAGILKQEKAANKKLKKGTRKQKTRSRINLDDWSSIIQNIVDKINSTENPTTGFSPVEMNKRAKKNEDETKIQMRRIVASENRRKSKINKMKRIYIGKYKKNEKLKPLSENEIKIGSLVKVSKLRINRRKDDKDVFLKPSTSTRSGWSDDIYIVTNVLKNKQDGNLFTNYMSPFSYYRVSNVETGKTVKGSIYREELLPLDLGKEHIKNNPQIWERKKYISMMEQKIFPKKEIEYFNIRKRKINK